MSDVTLLRKLTRKSIMKFGQYSDLQVQNLLDLQRYKYLRWVYFNCSNISFVDDILDEIRIPLNFRIVKPSKNPDLYLKLQEETFESYSDKVKEIYLEKQEKLRKKITKGKAITKMKQNENCYKKDYLRRKNQGNKLS
jgi:Rps23 Pro-64 3,4-dihydroxylase Tpa1-like proline 4-hydroxylase